MSRADAAARELLQQFDYRDLPVDPAKIAAELGAVVIYQNVAPDVHGLLLRRDGQVVIGLNEQRPPFARRTTLAHLVGHLHLHRKRELILDVTSRLQYGAAPSMPLDREETEANRFAFALLAPEEAVRRVAAEESSAADLVGVVAERFELSRTAASHRVLTLGLALEG